MGTQVERLSRQLETLERENEQQANELAAVQGPEHVTPSENA